MKEKCEICGIECELTKHHLIPQNKCKNKYKTLKNDEGNFLWVCRGCHDTIHAYFNNAELRDIYNTKDALMSNEKIASYVSWRIKHPNAKNTGMKMSNNRKNNY